jgi:hypothetical protein
VALSISNFLGGIIGNTEKFEEDNKTRIILTGIVNHKKDRKYNLRNRNGNNFDSLRIYNTRV